MLGIAQVAFALWLLAGLAERLAVSIGTLGMAILIVLVAVTIRGCSPTVISVAVLLFGASTVFAEVKDALSLSQPMITLGS